MKYSELDTQDRATAENEAVRWSILFDRTVEPETVWEVTLALRLIESDDFPTLKGKELELRSSIDHIVAATEVARELVAKNAQVHEIAAAIHAHACVVAEGAAKGRKFSPKYRGKVKT